MQLSAALYLPLLRQRCLDGIVLIQGRHAFREHDLSGDRGQAAQVVVIGAVGDGLQVFRIPSVGHDYAPDVAVLGHPDTLFLGDPIL